MQTSRTKDKIIISLEGRIDTGNASQTENEISSVLAENPSLTPEFDAASLEYISSAGLRVLLKFCKSSGKKLSIFNVSKEVFEIFETTGFTNILDVQKKLREISVEGCELLGQGGSGSVYRLDEDKIVKIYKPFVTRETIDSEREFARTAFMNGVPSVIAYDLIKCGEAYGIVFELIKSKTLGATIKENPEKLEEYVDKYVALAKKLHSIQVEKGAFTDIKTVLHERARNLPNLCTSEDVALLESLIDCMPDCNTIIHNDLHPGNIMIQDGELLLIDMPDMTLGPVIYDLCGIFRNMVMAPKLEVHNKEKELDKGLERSLGMPKDLIFKVGNLFFEKYSGISDKAELDALYHKLTLLSAFNVTLSLGYASEVSVKAAPMVIENLYKKILVPNEKELREILSTAR